MANQHTGAYYEDVARHNDLEVKRGGKHPTKIYGTLPNGQRTMMTVPYGSLAKGTECAIKKWFLRLGIILPILALLGWIAL